MSVFFMFRNERRAESKSGWEVIEKWNNMPEKQKKPYEKVQLTMSFSINLSLSLSLNVSATYISYYGNKQIAKENMEKYLEEMQLPYKIVYIFFYRLMTLCI